MGSGLKIEARQSVPILQHDLALGVADEAENAELMQPRQGTGDGLQITPQQAWRLIGPLTAMNGVLLFGWSAAVLFEVLRKTLDHLADIKAPGFTWS